MKLYNKNTGNASTIFADILFIGFYYYKMLLVGDFMVFLNIEKLLKKNGKTKYWLCKNMNITSRNLNRIIRGDTSSISFKYIEDFCKYLGCTPSELIKINFEKKQ